MKAGLPYRRASIVAVALLVVPGVAHGTDISSVQTPIQGQPKPEAQTQSDSSPPPVDALPGSPVPPGLGLSPEAPPVPPAPGGRAPSFGAPTTDPTSSFRIGGRFFGWEAIGIGEKPANPQIGYSGTAIHAPLLSTGKTPFWGGAGASLNIQYGTKYLTAYVSYYFRPNGAQYQGYLNPQHGPAFGTAYLLITPDPIGSLRLQLRVGAFTEVYAGPGQWGWGSSADARVARLRRDRERGMGPDARRAPHLDARVAHRSRRARGFPARRLQQLDRDGRLRAT